MLHWIYFVVLAIVGYIGASIFSRLVGSDAQSVTEAIRSVFKPIPFILMLAANIFLGAAVYYGFLASSAAIPIMLAIGVITTFVYSIVFLGVSITLAKVSGLLLIIIGIYLLK